MNIMPSIDDLCRLRSARAGRISSWDQSGRNADRWIIEPGEARVLADIEGPGRITHLWMTQRNHYRDCLIKMTWDDAESPSVLCPLGDFFCLGHGLVNSFQSALFTASTRWSYQFDKGCALNGYVPMPFRKRAKIELINESDEPHLQYFYIDYELAEDAMNEDDGYFHAEFRRENPFGGWGGDMGVNTSDVNVVNTERNAWENNYVILDTKGRGHYIGCNLSVTNFNGAWWGEGDDMIWVDGYKWPPDLHGTGSEDYLNQAWGMQENAFLRNGSSLWEGRTLVAGPSELNREGGYQTSYVFHTENPVHFQEEIKVTIEHGHANHLRNEMSSVAYWFAAEPAAATTPPSRARRAAVLRDNAGNWFIDESSQITSREVQPTQEMKENIEAWKKERS